MAGSIPTADGNRSAEGKDEAARWRTGPLPSSNFTAAPAITAVIAVIGIVRDGFTTTIPLNPKYT